MAAGMNYLAAWRQGSGAQWWVTGISYDDFKAKDKAHFDEGLRLVCLRVVDGKFTVSGIQAAAHSGGSPASITPISKPRTKLTSTKACACTTSKSTTAR